MDLEDLHASFVRRATDGDMPIESAGTQQCGIEHVGTVGGRHHDHRISLGEAVHLAENLIQRLFTFVMAAYDLVRLPKLLGGYANALAGGAPA